MNEHLIHFVIMGVLLFIAFFILFQDKLRITARSLLIVVFLLVFISSNITCCNFLPDNHNSLAQAAVYHSCCLGQVSNLTPVVSFEPQPMQTTNQSVITTKTVTELVADSINNKSPPLL